jgi:hypothetical protein
VGLERIPLLRPLGSQRAVANTPPYDARQLCAFNLPASERGYVKRCFPVDLSPPICQGCCAPFQALLAYLMGVRARVGFEFSFSTCHSL